jgi:cell division protein FtsW
MSAEPATVRLTKTRRDRTDVSIVLTAGALLIVGLVMGLGASSIRSAESAGSAFTLFARQFVWAALSCCALVFGWRFDYRRLRNVTYALIPVVWILLLMTLLSGRSEEVFGARRWLNFGNFQLQPSEIAKLVLIVFGADVLTRKIGKLDDWRHLVVPYLGAVGVTCLLVLLQPDFGTTVIIALGALAVCYLVGAELRTLGGITAIAALVAVPVMMSASYRRARLFAFLSGGADCLNTAYQTCQGLVALGSGRIFGLGLGSSRQKYGHLPNPETDFIFAILGEETGLVGTLTVLALFALLLVLGVRAAKRARDPFGFVIASGVTAWITLQVLINVGAVAGVLPITGVPLPLISFGGTSLLVSLAGLGLVASVARRGVRLPRKTT